MWQEGDHFPQRRQARGLARRLPGGFLPEPGHQVDVPWRQDRVLLLTGEDDADHVPRRPPSLQVPEQLDREALPRRHQRDQLPRRHDQVPVRRRGRGKHLPGRNDPED